VFVASAEVKTVGKGVLELVSEAIAKVVPERVANDVPESVGGGVVEGVEEGVEEGVTEGVEERGEGEASSLLAETVKESVGDDEEDTAPEPEIVGVCEVVGVALGLGVCVDLMEAEREIDEEGDGEVEVVTVDVADLVLASRVQGTGGLAKLRVDAPPSSTSNPNSGAKAMEVIFTKPQAKSVGQYSPQGKRSTAEALAMKEFPHESMANAVVPVLRFLMVVFTSP